MNRGGCAGSGLPENDRGEVGCMSGEGKQAKADACFSVSRWRGVDALRWEN